MRFALALAVSASIVSPVAAQTARIDIPAGSLKPALILLSRQSGASIGLPGHMPHVSVRAVRGTMPVTDALGLLLAGSPYRARLIAPNVWRLEAAPATRPVYPAPPRVVPKPAPSMPIDEPPADIIVTAAKRTEPLETTPLDGTTIDGVTINRFSAQPGSAQLAALETGIIVSNAGPGRNRLFLRGVSDSPFNGQTQSTVATLLDDARVTFNAPDPDLRLIDIDRVEILKGPQGPLYGTGAIGGVYRIVTAKPELGAARAVVNASVSAVEHGGQGLDGSAMLNLPVIQDRLAVRLLAYGAHEPGWIDNDRPSGRNSNVARLRGGRLAARWKPAADWTVDLAGAMQLLHVNDSQYTLTSSAVTRAGVLPEPHDNDFANARLAIAGRVGSINLFSLSSFTSHEIDTVYDASSAAGQFGTTGPLLFRDDRLHHVINQEFRASGQPGGATWMLGASFLSATTAVDAELAGPMSPNQMVGTLTQEVSELALFGNLGLDLGKRWSAEAGGRLFVTRTRDEKTSGGGLASARSTRHGLSPSLSLSFKPNDKTYLYLRAASAFRPAGLSPFSPQGSDSFRSDEMRTIELGGRWHGRQEHLSARTVLFANRWQHIQSDYLLPSGLIATRNAGNALIYGWEGTARWRSDGWRLEGGLVVQHAGAEGPERSLPIIPAWRANATWARRFDLGNWQGEASAHAAVNGPSRLSLDAGLDRRIPPSLSADMAISLHKGPWRIGLTATNLLNRDEDTFAYGNPFTIRQTMQFVPARPRTLSISLGWTLPN